MGEIQRQVARHFLGSAAIVACVAAAQPASAQVRSFDLPAQSAARGIPAFARQAGIQVVAPAGDVRGKRTNAVRGTFTVDQALRILLEGTGLRATPDRSTGITTIRAITAPPADQTASTTDEDATGRGATPEILVTGQRTLNADIRRTEDDTQPYVVLTSQEIQRSQARSVEEFLMTRLPMNTNQGFAPQSSNNAFGNSGRVNLRGLGVNQTLILLDGRRLPNANAPGAVQQPDINSIPVSAIERIEVLPATAAGIYGGNATGGAVNIILRRAFTGLELGSNYTFASRGDASAYRLDGTAGWSLEDGRTDILLSASYSSASPLYAGDRDFVARARALQLANNPAAFYAATTPPQGYSGNIRSVNGSNLVLDSGTALNSPFTFIPAGYAGVHTDGGRALAANAGQYDLSLPGDASGARQSLTSAHNEASVLFGTRRNFNDWLDIFTDASWSRNFNRSYATATNLNSVTLPAGAANNPFTTPIIVRFANPGLAAPAEVEFKTLRLAGGAIIRLPKGWKASADFIWARSEYLHRFTNFAQSIGDPDGSGPGISAASALANGTLDPVRDVYSFPLDWSPYTRTRPNNVRGPGISYFRDANLRLSGPLLTLPGGAMTLSTAFENRSESLQATLEDAVASNGTRSVTFNSPRSQAVNSVYFETIAPLVSAANARPGIAGLELQASFRHDWYTTRAGAPFTATIPSRSGPLPVLTDSVNRVQATGYTFGIRYEPFEGLILRASYGAGFLPPSITQIVRVIDPPITESLIDPKRGSVARTITFDRIGFGNPDLEPETSKSFTVGAVLEPAFLPGFRLSVDYVRISKQSEIYSSGARQPFLDLEDSLPGRIVRDPLTPADAALGYTGGAIRLIDTSPFNVSETKLHAIDIQADQRLSLGTLGTLRLYAVATWQPELSRRLLPDEPYVDTAGYSNGPLEWRGNAGFNWEYGNAALSWNAQYYDSYLAYASTASQATINTTVLNQGAARIPSQIYHDLALRFDFGSRREPGITLTAGVQNLFDKRPPILATTATSGGYSLYADPWLRRFNIGARVRF